MTRVADATVAMRTIEQLSALVTRFAGQPNIWMPRLRMPADTQRWWTRLASEPGVDVWLLAWLPGHATDLHDHGASAAAFTVVLGELTEVRLTRDGACVDLRRRPGSTTTLAAGVVHDVRGAGGQLAVSIHAYSPPLTRMTYYEIDARGRLRAKATVHSSDPERDADG